MKTILVTMLPLTILYLCVSYVIWMIGTISSLDVLISYTEKKFKNEPHFCVLNKDGLPRYSMSRSLIQSLFWIKDIIKFITF